MSRQWSPTRWLNFADGRVEVIHSLPGWWTYYCIRYWTWNENRCSTVILTTFDDLERMHTHHTKQVDGSGLETTFVINAHLVLPRISHHFWGIEGNGSERSLIMMTTSGSNCVFSQGWIPGLYSQFGATQWRQYVLQPGYHWKFHETRPLWIWCYIVFHIHDLRIIVFPGSEFYDIPSFTVDGV